ncbi:MAG: hypothetical protein ACO3RW_07350 [Burkholderiaceae bacterium]
MAEQSEQRQRYGYTDESGNRVSALRDMFNGGGPGQSGTTFQGGGALSSLGNALGGPANFGGGDGINMGRVAGSAIGGMALGPVGGLLGGLVGGGMGRGGWGYTDAMGNRVSAGTDMIDGGGRGMAGDTFQGGPFSGLLNAFGIRPLGYNARQAAMQQDANAPSLMAQPVQQPSPAAPVPESYGMTSMPNLTMDQIRLLQELGVNTDAMAGEPATASEMAALLRSPGTLLSMTNPQVGRMYAPQNPGAAIQPDGSAMPRYSVPTTSGVSMGQSDIGTVRPFTSRVPSRMPMQGFTPVFDISNPPPPPMGSATPPNAGVAAANQAYIEMQRRAAARGNPIRPMLLPR